MKEKFSEYLHLEENRDLSNLSFFVWRQKNEKNGQTKNLKNKS